MTSEPLVRLTLGNLVSPGDTELRRDQIVEVIRS
jgi:hypothetical protein